MKRALFSNIYDTYLQKLCFESRKRAVELLDLQDGQRVLDVACKTGENFSLINGQHRSLDIYGTDISKTLLRKGKVRIKKEKWDNITLFQADARELSPLYVKMHTQSGPYFDRIICALGLSAMPEWEKVLQRMLTLLKEGGRIVIVDVFAEKRNFYTTLFERFNRANASRTIWQKLEDSTINFHYEYFPVKERKLGGKLFVATGLKPEQEIPNHAT